MGNKKLKWQKFFSFFDNAYLIAVVLCLAVFLCLVSMAFVFTYKNVRQSSTKAMVEELELYTDEIGTALHEAELQLTKLAAEPQLVDFLENEPASPSELAEKILELDKSINIIFGPRTIHRLPNMISQFVSSGDPVVDVTADGIDKFDYLPESGPVGPSAFVTIMEGCSNKCTYCIVPYTRGEEQSRPVQDIIDECVNHIANGVIEIHLLGQNVNSYHGIHNDGTVCNFSTLLYEIAAIPGVKRIRFTTSNPMDFTDDIIEAVAKLDVISDSIHVPIQAGSDRILEAMHRRYTAKEYIKLVKKLRKARPSVHISSDFIVGFPGETEEDFNETMKVVNEVKFDQSFSFVYSIRPGTPAAALDDPVPKEVKMKRLYELQQRLEEHALEYTQAFVGTVQDCIVEGTSRKDETELKSRASSGRIVVFKGSEDLIGKMVKVKITSVIAHTLKGELLND